MMVYAPDRIARTVLCLGTPLSDAVVPNKWFFRENRISHMRNYDSLRFHLSFGPPTLHFFCTHYLSIF
jgi:hypothetical protein